VKRSPVSRDDIVNGLRQMSDQAGHPAALRHPH